LTAVSHDRLWEQIALCRDDGDFIQSLIEVYAELDRRLAELSAHCRACGRCCNFAVSGVRLYASTGELAALSRTDPPAPRAPLQDRCPYQLGRKCRARDRRPLGCRAFFCEKAFAGDLAIEYEVCHRAIRDLHQTRCLPYAYVDMVHAFLQFSFRK
jgi:Fe-S-cluster containining protein